MSEVKAFKAYRVFKIRSNNNNEKYYINYTKNKGYICMQLHNLITRYNKAGNDPEKYNDFMIIAMNDLIIDELDGFDTFDEAKEYI